MNVASLAPVLESLMEWFIVFDPQVDKYVSKVRLENPSLSRRELAQKIVDEQSFNNALLGSATGACSLISLPLVIPLDLVKAWKIQVFMIKCIAQIYGYTPHNTDLKTALLLLMSTGSVEEINQLVIESTASVVSQSTLNTVDTLKKSAIQLAATEGTKYATKTIVKYGEKTIFSGGIKEISKYLIAALCQIGCKKLAEKVVEKSLSATVPIIGAVIGGSVDWITTQAIGKLAIEYFESSVPGLIDTQFLAFA